jgi:hypothetical protein
MREGGAANCLGTHEYGLVFCEGGRVVSCAHGGTCFRGSWFGTGEGGWAASSSGVLGDGLVLWGEKKVSITCTCKSSYIAEDGLGHQGYRWGGPVQEHPGAVAFCVLEGAEW